MSVLARSCCDAGTAEGALRLARSADFLKGEAQLYFLQVSLSHEDSNSCH